MTNLSEELARLNELKENAKRGTWRFRGNAPSTYGIDRNPCSYAMVYAENLEFDVDPVVYGAGYPYQQCVDTDDLRLIAESKNAIDLANQLHDAWESTSIALEHMDIAYDHMDAERKRLKEENAKLHALLLEAEGALMLSINFLEPVSVFCAENGVNMQPAEESIIRTLTKLRAAGIGGSDDKR